MYGPSLCWQQESHKRSSLTPWIPAFEQTDLYAPTVRYASIEIELLLVRHSHLRVTAD